MEGHGRVEKRTVAVCHDVARLLERHDRPGLSAIGKVVGERCLADGSESADSRRFLLGGKPSAKRFGRVVPLPPGHRERRCPASDAFTGCSTRVDGRRPGAQPQGQRRRPPRRHPPAGAEHRPDASRQAIRPTRVRPRPARRRRPARHDPGHPQARVGGKSICDCPANNPVGGQGLA